MRCGKGLKRSDGLVPATLTLSVGAIIVGAAFVGGWRGIGEALLCLGIAGLCSLAILALAGSMEDQP